jgi:putative pyruvate formate lyase activating enzyme
MNHPIISKKLHISSIVIHRGEEPILGNKKGVCNVFFSGCNLQCIYCQNYQISTRCNEISLLNSDDAIEKITSILNQGVNTVGFVSPSHHISEMLFLIHEINNRGFNPVWIYNSNGFDSVKTLKKLDGIINIYLPDFKYATNALAEKLSGVKKYTDVALKSIKEMYFQKGNPIMLDTSNCGTSGLIIRHLVLPGMVENSINVLEIIAEYFSTNISISLMAQYSPIPRVETHPLLSRTVTPDEYQQVINAFDRLGFSKGWIQSLDRNEFFNPDFTKDNPFENQHP